MDTYTYIKKVNRQNFSVFNRQNFSVYKDFHTHKPMQELVKFAAVNLLPTIFLPIWSRQQQVTTKWARQTIRKSLKDIVASDPDHRACKKPWSI